MSTTIKTGWLKDKDGELFAPKTLTSQVQTSDGTLLETKIQADINTVKNDVFSDIENRYALAGHTHIGYAPEIHTHPEYFNANTGGTIDGDTNISGVLRIAGQQAFFFNEAAKTQTIGTNNATGGTNVGCGSSATVTINGASMKAPTILPRATNSFTCGSSDLRWSGIYSTAAVNVSSDERLKRDIEVVNADPLVEFIKNLNVVQYNYKDDPTDAKARIGLIAQQVQQADPEVAEFFVSKDENEMLGLKAADLVFPLILAVQRLSAEIDKLKSKA